MSNFNANVNLPTDNRMSNFNANVNLPTECQTLMQMLTYQQNVKFECKY